MRTESIRRARCAIEEQRARLCPQQAERVRGWLGTHWRILPGKHAQRSRLVAADCVGDVVVDSEGILDEKRKSASTRKWSVNQELTKKVTKNKPPADGRTDSQSWLLQVVSRKYKWSM